MIELRDLVYYYNDEIALNHVSARFEDGLCYALEGPNGCGKSTLFRILCGLSFAEQGEYLLDGQQVTEKKMKNRAFERALHRKIGYLFQNSETQLFTRSVEDEIAFGLYQLGYHEEIVHEKTEKYLDLLELKDLRKRAPYHLSGGEKKRCALAAVLAMEPEILILDEPIAGLDEDGQKWITDFLLELKKEKKTILVATHQKEFTNQIADERILMDKNHRLFQGSQS